MRIGHDDRGAQAGEVTADPRTVRARFERHGGRGMLGEQQCQGDALIEHGAFVNDPALGIQNTDVMAAITQIEPDGEPAGMDRGGGSKNNGRSDFFGFSFHRQSSLTQLLTPGLCLLILSC